MNSEQLAQIAYEAYANQSVRYAGFKPYEWHQLDKFNRRAWLAAAQAVKANVLSGFTKVGEGESSV